jgi:hypothetical protein
MFGVFLILIISNYIIICELNIYCTDEDQKEANTFLSFTGDFLRSQHDQPVTGGGATQ